MDNLNYPESMINEIKYNIEKLKELFYLNGKLHKKENKKYVITSEHIRTNERMINNIKNKTTKLTPRNTVFDIIIEKKLNMTRDEMKLYFLGDGSRTFEFKDGLNN